MTTITSCTPETTSNYRQYLLDRKATLEFELNRVLVEFNENFHYPDHSLMPLSTVLKNSYITSLK